VAGIGEPAYQHRVLESLGSAQNYIAWLASLARPFLGDDPIEIGAGAGDYAAAWLAGGVCAPMSWSPPEAPSTAHLVGVAIGAFALLRRLGPVRLENDRVVAWRGYGIVGMQLG